MAFIRSVSGLKPGRVRELTSGSLVLGRHPRFCDVVLEHYAVSREHARIESADGIAYIEDLESRNGVLVNGRPLVAGSAGRQRLYSGDRISIATFEFIYEEDPSSDVFLSDHGGGSAEVLSTLDISGDSSWNQAPPDAANLPVILAILEELTTAVDRERVLSKILDNLFQTFPQAHDGAILLQGPGDSDFVPVAVRRRAGNSGPLELNRSLLRRVASSKSAFLAGRADTTIIASADDTKAAVPARSVMCVPLIRAGEVLGLIQLNAPPSAGEFSSRDLAVLGSVARHLAAAIETSRLHAAAMQAQRLELEQRFRGLIEGSIQGILVHRQLQPLFVNEAYARLHGYRVAEILSLPSILPLITAGDPEQLLASEQEPASSIAFPLRYEAQGVCQDGTTLWLEKFVTVVDWADGPAFQVAVIDVTDRKLAEEALRAAHADLEQCVLRRTAELAETNARLEREMAERNRSSSELERSNRELEQFAYSVSHDLQSPLRTVTNYCQLLQRQAADKLSDTEAELLQNAVDGARRMKRLLDDLLAYSRVSSRTERFQSTDVNTVVAEAIRNLQAAITESGARVSLDVLPTVVGDATQLMMLFQNLIGNGIAYRRAEAPRIHVAVRDHADCWEFLVTDNGRGIAAENLDRVFQVLQRLHSDDEIPGSGLGLAIGKRIVERHGGRIWAESVPGSGSTFHFTLAMRPSGEEPERRTGP